MIRKLYKFTVRVETGHIELLEHDTIIDAGQEYLIGNHRRALTPGDDVSREHQQIQDYVTREWTPEIIDAETRRRDDE